AYVRDQWRRSARLQGRHRRPAHGAAPGPEDREELCRPGAERDFAGQAGFRYHLACLWLLDQIWVVTKTASALSHSKTCYTSSVILGLGVSPMRRREFIALLGSGVAGWPLAARAQQATKLPTIGFLGANNPTFERASIDAFVQRLRELGWIENRTVSIEYRWAEGREERFAEIAAEFIRLKVDVIFTYATPSSIAAKKATAIIPIVFAAAGDPVGTGLVASLARPGGNITGLSIQQTDLASKRLEMLREVLPGLRTVAILSDAGGPNSVLEM